MHRLEFPLRYRFDSEYPQLYVTFSSPIQPHIDFTTKAYIDTGAEWCLFHGDIAAVLGIFPPADNFIPMETRWGKLETYLHDVMFDIQGEDTSLRLRCKVAFDAGSIGGFYLENQTKAIIGRNSFLAQVSLCFHKHAEIYLSVPPRAIDIVTIPTAHANAI